jgi:hypothetical protein
LSMRSLSVELDTSYALAVPSKVLYIPSSYAVIAASKRFERSDINALAEGETTICYRPLRRVPDVFYCKDLWYGTPYALLSLTFS